MGLSLLLRPVLVTMELVEDFVTRRAGGPGRCVEILGDVDMGRTRPSWFPRDEVAEESRARPCMMRFEDL